MFLEAERNISEAVFAACVVSRSRAESQLRTTVYLETAVEGFTTRPGLQDPFWKPMMVACQAPPQWSGEAKLTLQLRHADQLLLLPQEVAVEAVPSNFESEVGACVSPYVTARPTFQDWLLYHRQLGVGGFHVYVPNGTFVDAMIEHFSHVPELRQKQPPHLFFSHYVTWHTYTVADWLSQYFGQVITMNDCVFRNRHKHTFLLMTDVDEFLSITNGDLSRTLHEHIPPQLGSVLLPISWYKVDCLLADGIYMYQGADVMSDSRPNMTLFPVQDKGSWWHNAKSIVRPLNVATMHVHQPLKAAMGALLYPERLEPSIAAIKHVRCSTAT